jgi:phage gp37-like protein
VLVEDEPDRDVALDHRFGGIHEHDEGKSVELDAVLATFASQRLRIRWSLCERPSASSFSTA